MSSKALNFSRQIEPEPYAEGHFNQVPTAPAPNRQIPGWHPFSSSSSQRFEERDRKDSVPEIWKGALSGAIGGLVAGFVMVQFQKLWDKASDKVEASNTHSEVPKHREQPGKSSQEPQDDATVKVAKAISEKMLDRSLRGEKEKHAGGAAVHYGFAVLAGALYGGLAEGFPALRRAGAIPYSVALFVGADEIAIPALGLSKGSFELPLNKHIYGLVSHMVYGATTELVRGQVRKVV